MIAKTYACVAATALGARCRNQAKGEFLVCGSPHTLDSPPAPPPDVVFLKFRINDRWANQLTVAGLRIIERSAEKVAVLNQKHADAAAAIGRRADSYRPTPDSGVPVFGKEGAKNVFLSGLWSELTGAGFVPAQAHVLKSGGQGQSGYTMLTLVVEMTRGQSEEAPEITNGVTSVIADLLASTWGFAHVWANPPREDGKIVHTINLSHRGEGAAAAKLEYYSGLWRTVV